MAENKKLVPKRRFKEFENAGGWEQRKLSEAVDFFDGQRKPLESGLRESGPYPYYGASGIIDYVKDYLFDEELILLSEDGANIIDRNYRLCFMARGKYWVNNHAHVLKSKYNYCNDFICESLERLDYVQYNTGTAQPKLNQEVCRNINILVPKLDEQQRISVFFSQLDNLITLHQQKQEKTKALKSAYLSEMFPTEGEREPKRRFAGFSGAWEVRKLGEVSDVRDGTHDSPSYLSDGHPFVTSKNVSGGYINYDDIQYISDADYKEINRRSRVDENDILMGMIGTIGNMALVRENPDFAIKNVALIKDTKNIYYLYLYHNLHSSNIINQLSDGMDGGTQKFIALNKIRSLIISIPCIEEQTQIGTFFSHLDNLIALHQRKLQKLQDIKKAYLNEMFIN